MSFIGGRAAGSSNRKFYTTVALALSLFAFLMFVASAWAQSEGLGDNRVRDTDRANEGDMNIDLVEVLNAQNCDVDPGAVIVFEDGDGDLFLVADGFNAQIDDRDGVIRVADDRNENTEDPSSDPDRDIEFLDETGQFEELPESSDLRVDSVAGIQCGNGQGGGQNPQPGRGPFVPEPFPPEAFPPGVVNPVTGEIIDEDDDGVPDIFDEEADEEDEEDEDETDDLEDAENDLNASTKTQTARAPTVSWAQRTSTRETTE